jgi:glyoxylase-like metal-dependent hydrolase (beta-lactamase superfamily II)
MKRALKILALVVGGLVLAVVGLFAAAFAGARPVVDGEELPGGARTVKDGIVSFFVLDAGGGELVLIDAGNDGEGKALLAELARRRLAPDAVKAVFLTHGHGDHVGGLRVLPKAEVYGFPAERPYMEGKQRYASPLGAVTGAMDVHARLTHDLVDGETVQIGAVTLRAFATPGHTAGSATYLAGGVLYFGDSADASSGGVLRHAKWLFSESQAQNDASLKALSVRLTPEAAGISTLVFAHSGPLTGLAPLQAFAAIH